MKALFKKAFFFFAMCILSTSGQADVKLITKRTDNDRAWYKPIDVGVHTSGLKPLMNCSLIPQFPEVRDHIASLATENKLIRVKVNVKGQSGPLNDTYPVSVYKPHQWIISTSLTGNSMLMLKEYFDAMSLWTLGFGVASASLTLIQEPSDCLKDSQVESTENYLRLHFLTNFEDEENGLPEDALICNSQVKREKTGAGNIQYVCCSRTLSNTLQCSTLKESVWFKLLFISITVLQALVVLYSPYLIPNSVYKAGNVFHNYIFRTEPEKLLRLNVKKITEKEQVEDGFIKTIQHNCARLKEFRKSIRNLSPGKVYSLYVERVDIAVRGSKLIAEGNAPVSVVSFIRNFFVRCKIRFEVDSVAEFCNQNVFKLLPCKIVLHWHECLGLLMRLLFAAVMLSPWFLRIWFYYEYEEETIMHQSRVLQNRNMTLQYTGSMLSYLSPTHSVYIGIYLLILAESILYAFVPASVKRRLKFTVGQCILDMRNTPKLDACGFFVAHMLWPLSKFGIFGCLIFPFWLMVLPLCFLYLAIEVLPIANLSVRLLVNSLYYTIRTINPGIFQTDKNPSKNNGLKNWIKTRVASILVLNSDEKNDRHNQVMQAASLILSFITMWAVLFVLIDCIAFYIECAVYVMVGFILNTEDIMKYVSLILLITVYGNECFSGVHGKYAAYSKAINTKVQEMVGDQVSAEASKPETEQENAAFRLPNSTINSERMHLEAGSEGYLKWRAKRLVLFLDKSDIPFIPKTFLFEMGTLNHHFCPGLIHLLYLKALLDFSLIIIFLMFVFIVIFAFGQAHDISSGGQTLAALGSGFLPLVFRKFLFQANSNTCVDKSNLKWKNMFENAVKQFATRWNFSDIHVKYVQENNDTTISKYPEKVITTESSDIGDTTAADTNEEESSVMIIQNSDALTEDTLRGNIDLVVRSSRNSEENEIMTFYVSDHSVADDLTNLEVIVEKKHADEESSV